MERMIGVINIFETDDYQKFMVDNKYNRPIRNNPKYKKLYNAIKDDGQIMPIVVKVNNDKYLIADGQHRFRILKELQLPVKFYIDNNIDLTKLLKSYWHAIQMVTGDFIEIAANREIPIFSMINRLFKSDENRLSITSLIEIVFTFAQNDGKSVFTNTTLFNACMSDYEKAFKSYSKEISDKAHSDISDFIFQMDNFSQILDVKLKVNFVKEALKYHLFYRMYGADLNSIANYLETEKPSRLSFKVQLQHSSKNQEFKDLFKEIATKIAQK
jgi:hypothetical protein